jgi:hypothetical protein
MRLVLFLMTFLSASQVFAQCSINAWSSFTGSPTAIGENDDPQGKKYEQSCGLTVDASTAPSFVTTDMPIDESTFSARFYLLVEALEIASGPDDYVTILRARDNTTTEFELRLISTGSVIHLVAWYQDNGSLVDHAEVLELQNVWQAVEVKWSAGAGDGTFEIKIDDIPYISEFGLTNGSAVVDDVDFGIVDLTSATGELVLDAIELRRAGTSGLLDISELGNISTRADVRTGDERVIGGFIVEGDTDKCVVVLGRGPSVGVDPEIRHGNPTLRLMMGGTEIASNDNWQDDPIQAETIANLGLAPGSNLDAGIHACIPPGPYTAILATAGGLGNIGVGIVEVYDADVGTPYLANISTRAPVGAGDFRAIGGFIVEGTEPKQVLIRARGPTVEVAEELRLPNPNVRLFDSGGEIAQNDNWGTADNAAAIFDTGLAPTNDNESAILITLDPGPYTAIVNGIGGSGIGIVEVYDLSGGAIAPQ